LTDLKWDEARHFGLRSVRALSREIASFVRLAERGGAYLVPLERATKVAFLGPEGTFTRSCAVLCLDTNAPPDAFVDERGVAEDRFVALSGFAPRRFAEETLEKEPASLEWLAKDAFDRLPREFLHEAPARMRVLGRLAYERLRAGVRGKLTGAWARVGIALDAGGGMSGAIVPLIEDVLAASPRAIIDVVVAIDQTKTATEIYRAQAHATLRELERIGAVPGELSPAREGDDRARSSGTR